MNTIPLAKQYSHYGWQCFPLKPHDKIPTVKWADVATSEENMLVGWFENQPEANIGIVCGARSGIVVLDVDAKSGGHESLTAIQEVYGKLPETAVAKTGGGGEHIFFAHPGIEIRNSAGRLAPGIDIRGDGGYVVGAPSIHPNGTPYEWIISPDKIPLAPFPDWMIELLKDTPPQAMPVSSNGKIANGSRNQTLTQLAGAMRRKGFSEDAMYQALLVHNREKCEPPLSDGDVLIIARSVSRYEPSAPVKVAEAPKITDVFSIFDKIEQRAIERQADPREVWGIPYAWPKLSKITGGKQPGELIYVAGDSGIGKSFWALQDAAYTAIYQEIPVHIWSGEMSPEQNLRRVLYMLGVDRRALLTGFGMENYWQKFKEAKALVVNSPLRMSNTPLDLKTVDLLMEREIGDYGVQQFLFDYDRLITAAGDSDTEKSQNISRTFKQLVEKYQVSTTLISSMNKMGMDTHVNALRSTMSGSAQKVYDSDVIFIFTPLDENKVPDHIMMNYKPDEYWKIITLNISKGRELDYRLAEKKLNYARETPRPSFKELVKE